MKKQFLQAGIVLKTHPLGEADVIACILTKNLGKISAVVRNAKNSKARFIGGVEMLDSGVFELSEPKGKSQLYAASGLSSRQSFPGLRENLRKLSFASYAAELCALFSAEGDALFSELFSPLFLCLRELEKAEDELIELGIFTLYLLLLLRITGHDALEARLFREPEQSWLNVMLEEKKVFLAKDEQNAQQVLNTLRAFIEQVIDKKLAWTI